MESLNDDVFGWASPPCPECPRAVQRVEQSWHWEDMHGWRLRAFTVCGAGHRVAVEPIPDMTG